MTDGEKVAGESERERQEVKGQDRTGWRDKKADTFIQNFTL